MEQIITAKRVYYDIPNKKVHPCKTTTTTTFDSKAEFDCYLMLDRLFPPQKYNIDVHHEIVCGDIAWKLDFFVSANIPSLRAYKQFQDIATIVNGRLFPAPPNGLYFEFKGRQDANYLRKMANVKLVNPSLAEGIILISYEDSAFGLWDRPSKRFITHAIVSQKNIQEIIKEVIWSE